MARTIKECLEQGPYTSKEIQAMTGLSQSSVARRLKEMADRIVQIREGRSIQYAAAACNAFGGDDKLPLSMVGPHGDIAVIAYVRPLCSGGFLVEPVKDISFMMLGNSRNGLYDGLPYFLYDMRPQGFLGSRIARKMAYQQYRHAPGQPEPVHGK